MRHGITTRVAAAACRPVFASFLGLSLALGASALIACGDSALRPFGSTCEDSDQCEGGLCYGGRCLDPTADDDLDGLANALEAGLGTDPTKADTDGDGVSDRDELDGELQPVDSDGDGHSDAIESRVDDADHDCLVDELDADDGHADTTADANADRIATACGAPAGVCAGNGAHLGVTCPDGVAAPVCDFAAVPDHEADESTCDARDNDCDGQTDEGCVPADPLSVGLIGQWPLDGDGADVGPYHDNGVVNGAAPAADRFGHAGKAMRFVAVGDRVSVAATHHPKGEVTVSYTAWIKPERDGGAAAGVLAFGDVLVPQRRSSLVLWGKRSCLEYTGEQNDFDAAAACAPDGRWSFVAAVKSGRHVKLYLNARLMAEGDLAEGQDVQTTALQIGLSRFDAVEGVYEQTFGVIDDVRAWGRALSDSELDGLYRADGWNDVGTAANPGESCLHVRDGGRPSGDGAYWLSAGEAAPFQAWCDMTSDGGGWTLAWVYGFTHPETFGDMSNAVTPRPTWPVPDADGPTSTTPPASPSTKGAIDFVNWAQLGSEVMVRADMVDTIACKPGRGSLVDRVSGGVSCRVVEDQVASCDGLVPWYLGWSTHGPFLAAQSLFLYWDGAPGIDWPTHDPCGLNVPPEVAPPSTAGGALYLRPVDYDVEWPAVCAQVDGGDRRYDKIAEYRIDPDGPGGRPSFMAECDFTTERGDWTRLSPAMLQAISDRGPRPRQYLYTYDGAWYRSPVTSAPWSWDLYVAAAGTWLYDGPTGEGQFDCAGTGPTGSWGIGCADPGATPHVLPAPTHDDASTTVCQAPPDAFGIGGVGCADDVAIWVRPAACVPDAGSLLGDGGFAEWAAQDVEDPFTCWSSWGPSGARDRFEADWDEVPPGGTAPSIKASNPEVGNDIWAVILNQRNLAFSAGRAYSLGFWAKAAAPRAMRVFIQTRDLGHAFYWEDVELDPEWTYYELGFVADATSYDAMIDFQLAEFSTADVWLDGVTLSDVGPSVCAVGGNDLVADPGFAHGRTCWRFGHDSEATDARAVPEATEGASDGHALLVEQHKGSEHWQVQLRQDAHLSLAPHRHYRVTLRAKADVARLVVVDVAAGPDNEPPTFWHDWNVPVSTAWQALELDFVTGDAPIADARLELQIGGHDATESLLWIDSASLVDVGPDPCTLDDASMLRDGDFSSGTACWSFNYDSGAVSAFAQRDITTAPTPAEQPSLVVAHTPGDDQVHRVSVRQEGLTIQANHWYRLSYWAKASAARTLRAAVWQNPGSTFTYQQPTVETTWRLYVHDFVADGASEIGKASVEFHLADSSGATVWLDDVKLQDLGADPCDTPDVGSLVADGGFAAGPLCWHFGYDDDALTATATSDGDIPTGGQAPSLKVAMSTGNPDAYRVGTYQSVALEGPRWYRLSFKAKAASARPIAAAVWDDLGAFLYRTPAVGTGWSSYSFDFVTDYAPDATQTGVSFQLADPSGATVWLDDVRLEDVGPSPCVPDDGSLLEDGELVAGTLCYLPPNPDGEYVISPDHPAATAGPSLAITNTVADNDLWSVQLIQRGFHLDANAPYTLTFWAKAAASRSIVALVHNWDTNTMHAYQVVDLTTEWTQYRVDFSGAASEDNVLVEFQFGDVSTETVWIDGLHLGQGNGLVSRWTFDEGSGATAGDSAGSNDGVVSGATWVDASQCKSGGCLRFDGQSKVEAPALGIPVGSASRTIALWLKPEKDLLASTESALVQWGTTANTQMFGLITSMNNPGKLYFFGYNSDLAGGPNLSNGQWYHGAVTYDGATVRLYVDGTLVASQPYGLVTAIDAHGVTIGWRPDGGYWTGLMDDVRIYDRALSADEIQGLAGVVSP